MEKFQLSWLDYTIILIYFSFVLGIGWVLRKYMKDSKAFLEAGRSLPAWITGLAFISANLGALEVMGMAASGAKYGMATFHFYWIGAVPAILFLALFMMPFYYGSKARSVPEYLKLRFDEKTRGFNAFSFLLLTALSSGISMYALALLIETLLGWDFNFNLILSAAIVLIYIYLGGLTSAIYNEVLQFFLIVVGFLPLVVLGLIHVGGWDGLMGNLNVVAEEHGFARGAWNHTWKLMGDSSENPMGVNWFGLMMGLGFVLSFGYWCTNFLVIQRAMAAGDMTAARKTPLIGAIPKMLIPFLVVVPGMIAIALVFEPGSGFSLPEKGAGYDYDKVIPMMLGHYLPTGILGVGITALMASFMSGMAGNVTAFNTVWTYDIYQSYINPDKPDRHYLRVGQFSTIFGVLLSMGTAYIAALFNNIMDFVQLLHAFLMAPLFGTFLLGMFWKRSTGHGAFFGLLAGTLAAMIHHGLTVPYGAETLVKGGWLLGGAANAVHTYSSEMAQNFWTAIYSFSSCIFFTIGISLATRQKKSVDQLRGLVYSMTPRYSEADLPWYRRTITLAVLVLLIAVSLTIIFW